MKFKRFSRSFVLNGLLIFLASLCLLLLGGWATTAQERTFSDTDTSGAAQDLAWAAPIEAEMAPSLAVTHTLYLPMLGRLPSTTTSSATLAQPPARGQLGLLGGLLGAGFLIGVGLVFWGEPEVIEPVQGAEEQRTDDPTQPNV